MDWKTFKKTQTWQEIRDFLETEFIDKPLDIDTTGKSAEDIAIEVRASQIASEKLKKALNKIKIKGEVNDIKPFTGI